MNGQTHWFFSHNISSGCLSHLEKRCRFSLITFLGNGENGVFITLGHKKFGICEPRNVMRENSPLLTLNICNAAKSIMRKYENLNEKRQLYRAQSAYDDAEYAAYRGD